MCAPAIEIEALQQPLGRSHRMIELDRQPRRILRPQRPPLRQLLVRLNPALRQPQLRNTIAKPIADPPVLGHTIRHVGEPGRLRPPQNQTMMLALLQTPQIDRIARTLRLNKPQQINIEMPRRPQIRHPKLRVRRPQHIRPSLPKKIHHRHPHPRSLETHTLPSQPGTRAGRVAARTAAGRGQKRRPAPRIAFTYSVCVLPPLSC